MQIQVENIKCGGCTNSINKKLTKELNITSVQIDIEKGLIDLDITTEQKPKALELLLSMGYPEVGSVDGFDNIKAKAKSFISCAIGKIDK